MNGIDEEFLLQDAASGSSVRDACSPITVLYAGNMGEGQGLHAIIPAIAHKLGSRVSFKLIGDGGRRSQLEKTLLETGVNNVELVAPMPRQALIKEFLAAVIWFLPLPHYESCKKVLPSKIF